MSTDAVALIGFVSLFLLMLLRVPVGMAMGLVGVSGFAYLVNGNAALKLVGQTSMRTVTDYTFGVIPMFLLMGSFVSNSGMSRELFRAANGFVGHLRGGLGIATVGACGGFAAICGSSVATAATFSAVAYPEMRRFGYPQSFATGVIAAGGTLGAMLPPSTVLAVYGIITEQDIGKLFIAGIIPGLLAMSMYMITIFLIGYLRPDFLPKGKVTPWRERFAGLKEIWAPVLLFVFVIGGLYGLPFLPRFTPTEAGGVGAAGAFIIGVVTGRLDREKILASLLQATRTAAAVFTVLIGALIFGYFLTVTQTPQKVTEFLTGLGLGPYGVLALIMVMYLVLGCLMDAMAMIILTVPIIFPVITHLGFDPIWFGVIIVMTVEARPDPSAGGDERLRHQERGEGRLLLHDLQGRDPVRGHGPDPPRDPDRLPAAGDLAADTDDGELRGEAMTTPTLGTKYVFTITAKIGDVVTAGETGIGVRRIIPIIGGEVTGAITGKVLPFGADFQTIRPNELIDLEAKYAFETDDGAVVYVENKGMRFGPVDLLQKLKRGEPVDPQLIYFRTVPKFETGHEKYRWLMEHIFVGSAARHADRVVIDVHQVV